MTQPQPERFQFTSSDGLSIVCVKWSGDHPVRGVVQIAHGLGEHMGRYADLFEKLVHGEFVVYGNDHRGHGLTAKPSGNFGDFGSGGFDQRRRHGFSQSHREERAPGQAIHPAGPQHGFFRRAAICHRPWSFDRRLSAFRIRDSGWFGAPRSIGIRRRGSDEVDECSV